MQNEVIEKKEKKPLSKKRIVAIVALSLVAVLLLVPIINQCIIELFNGELYEQDGRLQNTHVYMENVYVEDGVLHYTLVNDTIKEYSYILWGTLQKYVDGEWVICPSAGPPTLGNKSHGEPMPTLSAFGRVELTWGLEGFEIYEGNYRFVYGMYPRPSFTAHALGFLIPMDGPAHFSVVGTFEIPAAS